MEINVPLQPLQIELYRRIEDSHGAVILGIGGSKGSAKSHALRAIMLKRRMNYPNTAGIIFRRKMKQHRENTLEGGYFKSWPQLREFWQEQKRQFMLPNGSRIVLGIAEHSTDIDDYQGHEYMDAMPDEATRFTEMELVKINETRRWTGKLRLNVEQLAAINADRKMLGLRHFAELPKDIARTEFLIPERLCKTVLGMNPGGPGHAYVRRLMYKKQYHGKERATDYSFLPAFAWDNVEWARAALAESQLSDKQYYSWSDKERFNFFITRTQRGQELNALPARLRTGWLLGNWDEFAGQFYDIFDAEKHVKKCKPEKDWHPRWLAIDWGFQHDMSCHWFARAASKTKIYRELVANQRSARAQAMEIVDRTAVDERKLVDAIYLSPDAFQKRSEQDSFAELMGEVFVRYGLPFPTPADDDRIHGAQCMYDLMKDDELEIDPQCAKLIETIPMICTAEDDPEDIEKFEGDDAWDSARYGLKSRQRPGEQPVVEAAQDKVAAYAKSRNRVVEDLDPNTVAQLSRRAMYQIQKQRAQRRGGLGRPWRPQLGGA